MGIEEVISKTMESWQRERPDIDFTAMSSALKLNAVHQKAAQQIQERLGSIGVNLGEFDVLATLRRHGIDAVMTPSEIAELTMISQSGLTHRLTSLVTMGLITRQRDPNDKRSSLIGLTPEGIRIADRGIEIAVAVQTQTCMIVSDYQREAFEKVLDRLLQRADSDSVIESAR
jgi:DNA-binding MarR family transcriptional regulator